MANLKAQLAKALERVDKQIKEKILVAAESIGEGLVDAATVDTGFFAANYRVGINEERGDFDDFGVDIDIHSRQVSEAQAIEIAQDIPEFNLGDDIIWSNSVPHVGEALADRGPFDPLSDLIIGTEIGVGLAKQRVEK